MATRSGTFARIRLRAAVRRQSWRKRVGTPADWQAVRHAVRQRRIGMPSRWKTSRLSGVAACPPPRQGLGDGRRDGENPPHQRLRAGRREPDDATGHVNLLPGEAEDLLLAPAGVVSQIEDFLPRGGQADADGEVFGVLEEALAGGILAEAVGEPGHGVEPAPVDGERAHAVEGRGLPVDGAGGGPGGRAGSVGTGGSGRWSTWRPARRDRRRRQDGRSGRERCSGIGTAGPDSPGGRRR